MLRLCQQSDCHDVWEIIKEEMGYNVPFETTEEQFKKILRDANQQMYVYECDGKVVGFVHACFYDLLYSEPMINLLGIAVRKEFQHNGIGGLLLLMVEDWANDCGVTKVHVHTGEEREVAHAFYEAWGYECRKTHLNYIKSLED